LLVATVLITHSRSVKLLSSFPFSIHSVSIERNSAMNE
jgi:hypothetical protein